MLTAYKVWCSYSRPVFDYVIESEERNSSNYKANGLLNQDASSSLILIFELFCINWGIRKEIYTRAEPHIKKVKQIMHITPVWNKSRVLITLATWITPLVVFLRVHIGLIIEVSLMHMYRNIRTWIIRLVSYWKLISVHDKRNLKANCKV